MISVAEILAKFKPKPSDVVSVELSASAVKAVRAIKPKNGNFSILSSKVLPPVEMPKESPENTDATSAFPGLELPSELKGKYTSIVVSGDSAIIKLLSFPGHFNDSMVNKIVEGIGVENPDAYRINYKVISEGHAKGETRILAVALPETEATNAVRLFPVGIPAPFSLEVAPCAVMTSFINGPCTSYANTAVGLIDFGDNTSSFTLYYKSVLALVRRFDTGVNTLLAKIQDTLGVDKETAQGIISDGSFDISQSVNEIMEPLIKQMIVSRDFVERRENCHVERIYISGGMAVSRDAIEEMRNALGVELATWNPFENIQTSENAIPENLKGKEWNFAACIGACIATFEETTG